jgi:hypothetical protein
MAFAGVHIRGEREGLSQGRVQQDRSRRRGRSEQENRLASLAIDTRHSSHRARGREPLS